ncbi:IS110 family transposase [Micromonospora sp. ATA51]|uniref:IS110 family transposase n=1 Tax=Micromonospora sp. ATA51 TaxID=2806098 RepID=UPI001A5647BC|nr:IS110 family transposase [Micromonospora sp. ATA51]MBM0224430.1 IS110 family transposase [Micromonospora sp. ATA51]
MSIVGGLDIHRNQLTFDYVETETGRQERGRIAAADRERLAAWLTRFDMSTSVAFALEGCTGWRYVVEEMHKAGVHPHLAEPADTAALRGPKRRAKTDKADAKHLRELLDAGRLPECYIPPEPVLEWRAILELYSDLRAEHTGWAQRVHATCFHQGTTALGQAGVVRGSRERLMRIVSEQLSPAGRLQVNTALSVMDTLDEHLGRLRQRIVATARQVAGAQALMDAIYGVGPMTSLALVCWLGGADRFSASRKAVRFVGLDITVRSSDSKRSPGRLSRQGPEVLRWLLFEAAKTSARSHAPAHGYYTSVRERYDGNRAALSQARRIVRHAVHILTDLGDDAFTITRQPTSSSAVAAR